MNPLEAICTGAERQSHRLLRQQDCRGSQAGVRQGGLLDATANGPGSIGGYRPEPVYSARSRIRWFMLFCGSRTSPSYSRTKHLYHQTNSTRNPKTDFISGKSMCCFYYNAVFRRRLHEHGKARGPLIRSQRRTEAAVQQNEIERPRHTTHRRQGGVSNIGHRKKSRCSAKDRCADGRRISRRRSLHCICRSRYDSQHLNVAARPLHAWRCG